MPSLFDGEDGEDSGIDPEQEIEDEDERTDEGEDEETVFKKDVLWMEGLQLLQKNQFRYAWMIGQVRPIQRIVACSFRSWRPTRRSNSDFSRVDARLQIQLSGTECLVN